MTCCADSLADYSIEDVALLIVKGATCDALHARRDTDVIWHGLNELNWYMERCGTTHVQGYGAGCKRCRRKT